MSKNVYMIFQQSIYLYFNFFKILFKDDGPYLFNGYV